MRIDTVGLVGCGRMGAAIGRHLIAAGWPLVVTDADRHAVEPLAADGAAVAESVAEVAALSELVLVVVVDDEQVTDVVAGAEGALVAARPGTVVAVCASVRPQTCRALAARAERDGVDVVDVALVGGERGAEAGTLVLMCGGPDAVIDACRPAFAAFADEVCLLGGVGSGQVAKTANNLLLWACLRADLEAQRLARALGVEPRRLRAALAAGSGANRALADWGEHRLRWPAKDLALTCELAAGAGVEVPLAQALGPLMDELSVADLHELR